MAPHSQIAPANASLGAGIDRELIGEDVGGIALHIGARVAALAQAGEVVVSSTVKDLVVGSGIDFEDRGSHALKGVPGEWRIYAAVSRVRPDPRLLERTW